MRSAFEYGDLSWQRIFFQNFSLEAAVLGSLFKGEGLKMHKPLKFIKNFNLEVLKMLSESYNFLIFEK